MKFFSLTHRGSVFVPYALAHEYQKELVEKRARDEIPDTFLLVEHPSTVTRGRGLQKKDDASKEGESEELRSIPMGPLPKGTDYFEVERGGDLTWHGPGQLVIYPIVKLDGKDYGPDHDVTGFLRKLEQSIGEWLESYGLTPDYRPGATGLWIKESGKKIASMGIAVRKWVTYHGVAINLANTREGFQAITPCGFSPELMTTLAQEVGGITTLTPGVRYRIERELASVISGREAEVSKLPI